MAAHIPRGPTPDEQRLQEVLAVFVSELAFGRLPPEVRDIFCSARLIGIPKKPSGTRPIAIGETLRRLAAKCLIKRYQADAAESMVPTQVGVSIPGATEAIVHKVREWAASAAPDEALLQVDFRNAFNTVDRSAMLASIAETCP